jgi:hypothetical protein
MRVKFVILILLCVGIIFPHKNYAQNGRLPNSDLFPMSPQSSPKIDVLRMDKLTEAERLVAYSLQGLVNRQCPQIYLLHRSQTGILDFYREHKYVKRVREITKLGELVSLYKKVPRGLVVFDPEKTYMVNLASNLASVEDRIMVAENLLDSVLEIMGKKTNVFDLRQLNLKDDVEAIDWYMANVFPKQNHQAMSVANNHSMNNIFRDYLIAFKIPTFWLPGKKDIDYSKEYEERVLKLYQIMPDNIPVLGFWPARDIDGNKVGYQEFPGVKLAGEYAKFTTVSTHVGNYSFHSGVKVAGYQYKQTKVRNKPCPKYDKSKKYVALVMTESGDAPGYMLTKFRSYQWEQPNREKVPVSYGINPLMQYLYPALTKYYYDSASENNFFFNSISGAGYCYPFEGYGSKTSDPEKTVREYFKLTSDNMKKMDLDVLALYTHPKKMLSGTDLQLLDTIVKYVPVMKSFVLGMHKVNGYDAGNSHGILEGNVSYHHTITRWPSGNVHGFNKAYEPLDEKKDDFAVEYMVNEIRRNSAGGNFIQAMFYSWFYGPRRLAKVQEILEKEGYVFVTLNHFDKLYREAQK